MIQSILRTKSLRDYTVQYTLYFLSVNFIILKIRSNNEVKPLEMSSNSSETSGSQCDSDTNFIPGYIMEIEEPSLASTTNISTDETLSASGDDSIQPYQDEPLADENWIYEYIEQRKREENKLQILQRRLDRLESVNNWWVYNDF